MYAYKRFNRSDLITLPYTANKQWEFFSSNINSSSIYILTGQKMTGSFNPSTDPMTFNGQYQRLVYDYVNSQFYQDFSGSYINTSSLVNSNNYLSASIYRASASYTSPINISYGVKNFPDQVGDTVQVLKIPQAIFGNAINKNSFELSSSVYNITDDGYGNLVDQVSSSYVGNIFYSQGIAVITNQSYQSYFTDSTLTDVFWSNFNTPYNYTIDGNLEIFVNGISLVDTYFSQNGRVQARVGDTILIESWSDGTWPSTGNPVLNLAVTSQSLATSSVAGVMLTQSFVIPNQSPIHINSYTTYNPPVQVYWYVSESVASGSLLIKLNGANKVSSSINSSGSFTSYLGDTIYTQFSGSAPWPASGSSSEVLYIPGVINISSSVSSILSSSFVLSNQNDVSIQAYTTYTPSDTLINWSTYYTGSVDGNLQIIVNGISSVHSNSNGSGSLYVNRGDTVSAQVSTYAPWPTSGSSSMYLTTTGYATSSTSDSSSVLSNTFSITSSNAIDVSAFTQYIPYVAPSIATSSINFYFENYDNSINTADTASYFLSGSLNVSGTTYQSSNFFVNPPTGSHGSGNYTLVTGSISANSGSVVPITSMYNNVGNNWNGASSANLILQIKKNGSLIYNLSSSVNPGSSFTYIPQNITADSGSYFEIYGGFNNLYVIPPTGSGVVITYSGSVQINNESNSTLIFNSGEGFGTANTLTAYSSRTFPITTPTAVTNTFRIWKGSSGVPPSSYSLSVAVTSGSMAIDYSVPDLVVTPFVLEGQTSGSVIITGTINVY